MCWFCGFYLGFFYPFFDAIIVIDSSMWIIWESLWASTCNCLPVPPWGVRQEESVVKARLLASLVREVGCSQAGTEGAQALSGISPYALQKLLQPVSWGPEAMCMFKLGQNLSLYPSVPSWLEFSAFLICWGFFFPVVGAEVLQISKAGLTLFH